LFPFQGVVRVPLAHDFAGNDQFHRGMAWGDHFHTIGGERASHGRDGLERRTYSIYFLEHDRKLRLPGLPAWLFQK
jgi:hypothetical protein